MSEEPMKAPVHKMTAVLLAGWVAGMIFGLGAGQHSYGLLLLGLAIVLFAGWKVVAWQTP